MIFFAGLVAVIYSIVVALLAVVMLGAALYLFGSAIVVVVAAPFRAKIKAVPVPPAPEEIDDGRTIVVPDESDVWHIASEAPPAWQSRWN